MTHWILWYLVSTALGWLAFPIAYRLLPRLPDRGFSSSRVLGLLVWGFTFWLLASLGILPFNDGGLLFAAALLALFSLWALLGIRVDELLGWFRSHKRLILVTETLFLAAFAAWAVVRAANPDAVGTEKPMELAFINAILRSPDFPPHDPWLSGYAISYYYFGYVIISMLAKITGTDGGVAFNLGISLIFALSASGAYSLVFNLLNATKRSGHHLSAPAETSPQINFSIASIFGPLYVLIVSNLEGFLHVLHTRGLLWTKDSAGSLTSSFWRWLDIQDLSSAPQEPFAWIPTRFWWWWRASRVLQDYDLSGATKEIIDEFPFFSFLLADLHPHVLALPFAFLAITLALSLFLTPRWQLSRPLHRLVPLEISPVFFLLATIALGGMAFFNTWDFPVYVFIFAGAYALNKYLIQKESLRNAITGFFKMGIAVGIAGILLYLPFYLGFSSQAGGILPNLIYPTRGIHLWVMFAPLFIPILAYLIHCMRQFPDLRKLLYGFGLAAGLMIGLWAFAILLGFAITLIPDIGKIFLGSLGAPDGGLLFRAALSRRLSAPGGWITLLLMLGLVLSLFLSLKSLRNRTTSNLNSAPKGQPLASTLDVPDIFLALLILTGLLLVLTPEFIYLRDLFGWRMNTIFKFYFQAWLILSIAGAYTTITLWSRLGGLWRSAFQIPTFLLISASLVYPILSLLNKTSGFQPREWTLDSTAYFSRIWPDDMAAIDWLKTAPFGVVAEAVPDTGGSYSEYARVATLSGLPAVLGWVGHENQWRGSDQSVGSRRTDLGVLYCARDWQETRGILEQYAIRYVFIGTLERTAYQKGHPGCPAGLQEVKFQRNLISVYEVGQVAIYEFPDAVNDARK